MYGSRARIGLIIPSINVTMEPEFNVMKPDGVSVHATRLLYTPGVSIKNLRSMDDGIEEAASLLATEGE